MNEPPPAPHERAADYWDGVLDPQNLEHGGAAGLSLDDELFFARAPDLRAAEIWLTHAPRYREPAGDGGFVMDLGAGLGANTFALALVGHRMLAVDTSPARLRALMQRARAAGVADRVVPVVAAAERLPLRDGALVGLYTKSVLIHTDLPAAAAELGRVLAAGGRAALIEPQPGNPFAALYRRTLAPPAWRSITRYFERAEQHLVGAHLGRWRVEPFYLLGFLAFVFHYARPWRRGFAMALKWLGRLDALLFRIRPLRRLAWFGAILAEKPPDQTPQAEAPRGR